MTFKQTLDNPYSDDNYQDQLDQKIIRFQQEISHFGDYPIQIYPSKPLNFRMRAEFRIWHENGAAHYAMNKPGEKKPYIITEFPIAGPLITVLMKPLLEAINANHIISHRLFSVEFLTTDSGQSLVTLIYHKPLDDTWQTEAELLQAQLSIFVIGRSRKQKRVLTQDFVTESILVDGRKYLYQQVESGFTQPNVGINANMLTWASACCARNNEKSDLLELYCGNGNFTAVLAQHFKNVLATEVSKVSVLSAETNLALNEINNVIVVRLSSEEITQALNGDRPFRRLRNIDLSAFNFSTVFVDPPRSGLDEGTEDLVARFDKILYVSCNPTTLINNLSELCKTHDIVKVAAFDQFPWTEHLETGVFLVRKDSA
ncbi:tRNA (uridine(54)-C5)-methyltransferase TrmA [Gammaproteobacteria bacterium]|nr:tRNA (uridine(54)-C5)-methyltransferase TrmA [Gammaproteobacteria bacterium]|tara:strand:+ start:570 stop:1685 length:1116 start_codon:yes stop_codon:yes gene_type:complete